LKKKPRRYLAGEYVVPSRRGPDREIAAARWEFIKVLKRLVPECFQALDDDMYLVFARLKSPENASNKELESLISGWARRWHLDVEWIRAGARETVMRWNRYPNMRKDLGLQAFLPFVADAIDMAGFPGGCSTEVLSDAGEPVVTAKVPNLY
jgi:hypothetical protein